MRREYNKFHELFMRLAERKCAMKACEEAGVCREQPWQISYRPFGLRRKRQIKQMAAALLQPTSKLEFIAGFNPWTERLCLEDQLALWEFCERIVRMKEMSQRPFLGLYSRLVREMFGGAEIVIENPPLGEFIDEQNKKD